VDLERARVIAQLEGHTVAIDPYAAAIAPAYPAFTWRPVPIFQSYSAYTAALDGQNADMLRSAARPDRILRQFVPRSVRGGRTVPYAMDGRDYWFESPEATVERLCRYEEVAVSGAYQVLAESGRSCGAETPLATVTATLWDVHPPTWFLAMWSWTKLFGVSLFAIRLPSVLFGTLAVALTFWLATLDIDWKTGLLGAAFLAFNGHQILWSQLARPYTVTCCIGLCASGFLLLAQRPGRRQSMWTWLYGATALGGLYTLYYFWPVFLTHALWVAVAGRRQPQRFYGLLRLQLLLLILASPIVTLAVFQSRQSYLSDDGFAFFTDFVRFAFLFEPDGDVVRPFSRPAEVAFLVGSVLLLALGLTRGTRRGVQSNGTSVPGPSLSTLALTTIVSCICVAAAAIAFRTKSPHKALQLAATIVVPIAVFGLAVGVTRVTSFALRWRREDEHARAPSLVVMLAVLPTVIVAGISLAVPFLASKGMILFAPYLLIVLAAGVWRISELGRGGRVAAVATVVILGAAHVASVRYHASRPFAPQDYQGLAETWEPQLHERDVVFAQVWQRFLELLPPPGVLAGRPLPRLSRSPDAEKPDPVEAFLHQSIEFGVGDVVQRRSPAQGVGQFRQPDAGVDLVKRRVTDGCHYLRLFEHSHPAVSSFGCAEAFLLQTNPP
jgi:uncharacterized membrane protein